MKVNQKINPGQIPFLVRLTADLFREMNQEIDPVLRPGHMHFVAGLLKDLVDTAYPMEEKQNTEDDFVDIKNLIKVAEFQSFDEMMEAVAEIARATKPPKAGEF